mgnify:FL=1
MERINPPLSSSPTGYLAPYFEGVIGSFWELTGHLGDLSSGVWVVFEPQRDLFSFAAVLFLEKNPIVLENTVARSGFAILSKGRHATLHALPTREVRTSTASDCPAAGIKPPIEGTFEAIHCVACSETSARTTELKTQRIEY